MRLCPDVIELDRALIEDLDADPAKAALVDAFARFAERTGSAVCAEGIETHAELDALARLDIQLGQGYLLARPAPFWPQPELTAS